MWIGSIIFGFVLIGNLRTIKAIEFKDNGYYDVLVSISPDVVADPSEQVLIVDNIKVLLYQISIVVDGTSLKRFQ